MASHDTFPKHYFVWSRKIEGLEDFVQLYMLQKARHNEREFLVERETLLQEEQKKISSTDLLTLYLSITKNEIIPLSVGNIAENYDTVPRLHYNIFKNGFTAGILMVKSTEQHTINSKVGCIYVYICKRNEKRGRYITNANCGRALINETQILEDFHPPELVVPGKPYVILQNSVYFFYATDLSSFIILNNDMVFRFILDFNILLPMKSYVGPISRSCFKEYELNYPGLCTFSKLDSKLPKSTEKVIPLSTCSKPVDFGRVMEDQMNSIIKAIDNMKMENFILKTAVKELENIRKENMKLKAVEKELEQVKDKYLTNSMKLKSVETELRNVKIENVSLKVAERTLESVRKENTRLKAEKKELENIRENFRNEQKAMKIEAREMENIKNENTRLKNILQRTW